MAIRKTTREYQIVQSDRTELINAANVLVSNIIYKQVAANNAFSCNLEISSQEEKAFDAALEFLHRQFQFGFKEAEPFESRIEIEDTSETGKTQEQGRNEC